MALFQIIWCGHMNTNIKSFFHLLSVVQRLPECPLEKKFLPESFIVCSIRDLHQPSWGEHAAAAASWGVPHRALHLRAWQRGRLRPQGFHWKAVRDRVCFFFFPSVFFSSAFIKFGKGDLIFAFVSGNWMTKYLLILERRFASGMPCWTIFVAVFGFQIFMFLFVL